MPIIIINTNKNMQSVIQCQTCDPSESKMITDVESGEIICNQCGIVVVQDLEDTRKRTPTSLTLYDQGLATLIGKTNRDASGNVINSMMMTRLNKMRFHDKRSQINKSARNLGRAFRQLDSLRINLV